MQNDDGRSPKGPAEGSTGGSLTRRKFLKVSATGAVLAGTGALAACESMDYAEGGDTPKSVAAYQDTPNGEQRCAGCRHFLAPNRCRIVAGDISPNGWCRFYEPRAA